MSKPIRVALLSCAILLAILSGASFDLAEPDPQIFPAPAATGHPKAVVDPGERPNLPSHVADRVRRYHGFDAVQWTQQP
jgi:hypothetical protein